MAAKLLTVLALVALFLAAACLGGCTGDDDDNDAGDDDADDDDDDTGVECPSVIEDLQALLDAAGATVDLVGEGDCTEVTAGNLEDLALSVAEGMVFLLEAGPTKVGDSDVAEEERQTFADELIDEALVAPGDFVLVLNWENENAIPFSTLAVVTAEGELRFDSIVFYNTVVPLPAEDPGESSKGWNVTHKGGWENLFGMEIDWDVSISVQTDGCLIVDPAPHAVANKLSQVLGCQVEATVKETAYCSPNQHCPQCSQGTPKTEDAIKVELNVAFACGFKKVKIGADKFTLEVEGNIGTNGSEGHTYNVGASSGLISWQ